MNTRFSFFLACLLLSASLATGAASAAEKFLPSVEINAPPKANFGSFDRMELAEVKLVPPYDKHKANVAAREKIQLHFASRLAPMVTAMNSRPTRSETPSVLVIEPMIEKITYIGTGARIWAGAFAGSSQILMRVRISDKTTGDVVAEPEFYQRANAWGGAYSAGSTDNDMLSRIVDLVTAYVSNNVENAVGGPTGAEGLKN